MKKLVLIFILYSISTNAQIKLEHIKSLSGNSPTDQLSNIVALGDINKDGYDDFALHYYVKSDSLYAKIYFGGKPFDTTKTTFFTNPKPKFYFKSVHGGGDLNDDGISDFVIVYLDNTAIHNPPQFEVQIHFGGNPVSQQPDYTIICAALWNCVINGDYNGDGFDDLIITTLMDSYWGSVQIYFGGKRLHQKPNLELNGLQYSEFARYCKPLGDVNNDGCDDFIVSTKVGSESFIKTAFLFMGGNFLTFSNSIKFAATGLYGYSSALGDINADGYKDFFVYGTNRDIFLGGNQIDPNKPFYRSQKWLFNGIGDINKDGYDDYIKFLNEYVELHFGSSSIDTIPELILNNTPSNFTNIGDINGDGKVEIANGALYSNKIVSIYNAGLETSVIEEKGIPTEYHLSQNYPNPFNPETTIEYSIPVETRHSATGGSSLQHVTLEVYDLLGREVATLVDEYKQAGNYKITFNARHLERSREIPSGVYFYKLTAGSYSETKKMMVLK